MTHNPAGRSGRLVAALLGCGLVAAGGLAAQDRRPVVVPERGDRSSHRATSDGSRVRPMPEGLTRLTEQPVNELESLRRRAEPEEKEALDEGLKRYPALLLVGVIQDADPDDPPLFESPGWLLDAAQAGREMAELLVAERGVAVYRRTGVAVGFRMAVDDEALGAWDRDDGSNAGSEATQAWRTGTLFGTEAARDRASEDARAAVREAFLDLSSEPLPDPDPPWIPGPSLPPPSDAAVDPRDIPAFLDLMAQLWADAGQSDPVDPDLAWIVRNPSVIYSMAANPDTLFAGAWGRDIEAFGMWLGRSGNTWIYEGLGDRADRAAFQTAFDLAFDIRLDELFTSVLEPAYAGGFDAGWQLGAEVNAERFFALGYEDAYDTVLGSAVRKAWYREYPGAYTRAYLLIFADWLENPHPELVGVSIRDGGDDGVVEPGESIIVDLEIVNYGGVGGDIPIGIEGPAIKGIVESTIELGARGASIPSHEVGATILADAAPRSVSFVEVSVGAERLSLELLVDHPLQFSRAGTSLVIDPERRSAVFEVAVRNSSRVAVRGVVELIPVAEGLEPHVADLGAIEPNAVRAAVISLTDLDPDMVADGSLPVELTLTDGTRVVDRLVGW